MSPVPLLTQLSTKHLPQGTPQGLEVLLGIAVPPRRWHSCSQTCSALPICLGKVRSAPVPGTHWIACGSEHAHRIKRHAEKDHSCLNLLHCYEFHPVIYPSMNFSSFFFFFFNYHLNVTLLSKPVGLVNEKYNIFNYFFTNYVCSVNQILQSSKSETCFMKQPVGVSDLVSSPWIPIGISSGVQNVLIMIKPALTGKSIKSLPPCWRSL